MRSVEYDSGIRKRVRFNRPFSFIKIFIDDVANIIPKLSLRKRHLLWIDYGRISIREGGDGYRFGM